MKSITFLMPPFQYSPVGGFKVALEYANRLAADGYIVHVVYADATKYRGGDTLQDEVEADIEALPLQIRRTSSLHPHLVPIG